MGQFGMGQGLERLEDQRLLTGAGNYIEDTNLDNQAYALFVRSPFAHAEITGYDLEDAREADGVLAVLSAEDLTAEGIGDIPCLVPMPGKDGSQTLTAPYPALARDRVRHVGDAVVLVVAETLNQARDAAELVMVDYEPLDAVTNAAEALKPGAPQVHPEIPGNLSLTWAQGDEEATAQAFAKAHKIAQVELINNRVVVSSMETRGCVADYAPDSGRFTLYTGSQGLARLGQQLREQILKIGPDQLHLKTHDVGGGFGMKIFAYPEQVACLVAARRCQRPVKWISERTEAFLSDTQGRDHITTAQMALDADGQFLGIRVDTVANLGGYLSNFAPYIPTGASTQMFSGLYRIPAIYAEVKCAMTNTVPVDAYRGAGRPEAAYVMERLVDRCAKVMGLDPREIRRRNFIRPSDLPYDTGLGRVYDSGAYEDLLNRASDQADWDGLAARKAEALSRGKHLGLGLASYVEACSGIGDEEARMTLDADGGVTIAIGTVSNGQGHLTAYAQLVNDALEIDPAKVRMIQGDSEICPATPGTGGSRSVMMGGVATTRASEAILERARAVASHLLEAAEADIEFAEGAFTIVGTDRRISLEDIAKATHGGDGQEKLPEDLQGPIKEKGEYTAEAMTFPNGCHMVEVEVDADTGQLDITRYTIADDFGTIVNPLMAAGQVHGGTAQGLGQALLEHTYYDEDGQLVTASYMDYGMPRADDMPAISLEMVEDYPCTTNPMGMKGAGEAGAIGAPPAIINALLDALAPLGVTDLDMPATPLKIWEAIQAAQAKSAA
ncbi:xanthine dehydrogenase family protein molybdopterin-binding subunit [Rhodovibrionaceae bacterium A322]